MTAAVSSGAPCRIWPAVGGSLALQLGSGSIRAHLIYCKADGLHVAAKTALAAAMLLHERQDEAAA